MEKDPDRIMGMVKELEDAAAKLRDNAELLGKLNTQIKEIQYTIDSLVKRGLKVVLVHGDEGVSAKIGRG